MAQQSPPPPTSEEKTPDERKQILAQTVANTLAQPGRWRMESQSDYNAIVVKGSRPNHTLHLILSIVTIGFWLIIWLIIWLVQKERKYMLTVDAYGNTTNQQL